MSSWKRILSESITNSEGIGQVLDVDVSRIKKVISRYPMRINPYYLSLIKEKDDPIYKQAVPDIKEIQDTRGIEDPLNEEGMMSPVPGLTHRYPDRVLLLVSSQCAMYCRFCNRKRKVGKRGIITKEMIREGIGYIKAHKEIKEVLISGGDPLILDDHKIYNILKEIREISHVEVIRIGTRIPCTLPQRITKRLANMLSRFQPLYIVTHFNHPREITPEASAACTRLANVGVPLASQTVLLKGINDHVDIIKELMRMLLRIRVRPYYLFYPDYVKGTAHFWPGIEKGIEIMKGMYGYISGLCIPRFAIDLTGGGGKVPIVPDYIKSKGKDEWLIRNYKGQVFKFTPA